MRCRLLTPPLERASRVWGINSPNASIYWLMEGICGHWPSKSLESTTRSTAKEQRTKSGKERRRVAHANISIYTYICTSFFYEKKPTLRHPNGGSQKTLRALQNSDPCPRLGDSRQPESKPTGQLALDSKTQSQDRYSRPFRQPGRVVPSSHRRPSRA